MSRVRELLEASEARVGKRQTDLLDALAVICAANAALLITGAQPEACVTIGRAVLRLANMLNID